MRDFSRCQVLVVADFDKSAAEAVQLCRLGARVVAAGVGSAAVKRELEALGVRVSGVMRWRSQAGEAVLDRLGGCDAILFGAGDWAVEFRAAEEFERELAAADGRFVRPIVMRGHPDFRFLRSARQRARFVLARAAGAGPAQAEQFAKQEARGHAK